MSIDIFLQNVVIVVPPLMCFLVLLIFMVSLLAKKEINKIQLATVHSMIYLPLMIGSILFYVRSLQVIDNINKWANIKSDYSIEVEIIHMLPILVMWILLTVILVVLKFFVLLKFCNPAHH